MTPGDSDVGSFANWRLGDKIKKVVKFIPGKGFHCSDNKFPIDMPFAFKHPVNLTYRYFHSLG
jgi:hypothetical protein